MTEPACPLGGSGTAPEPPWARNVVPFLDPIITPDLLVRLVWLVGALPSLPPGETALCPVAVSGSVLPCLGLCLTGDLLFPQIPGWPEARQFDLR